MAERMTCTWTGVSGKKYVYDVFPRGPTVPYPGPGNFIYARMDEHRRWVPIYIGTGDLIQCAGEDQDAVECVDAKGARHVHMHASFDHDDRAAEAWDLLENFPHACGAGRRARTD